MKRFALLILPLLVAACATAPPPQEPERLFNDALFKPASVNVSAAEVFALSPEMRNYLDHDIAARVRTRGRQYALIDALYQRGATQARVRRRRTRNAAEAFAARSGNCLSLVIMTAAFAKELGMIVRYQHVFAEDTWSRDRRLLLRDRPREPVARPQGCRPEVRRERVERADDRLPAAGEPARTTHVGDRRADDRRDVHEQPRGRIADDGPSRRRVLVRARGDRPGRRVSWRRTTRSASSTSSHGNLAEAQRALEFVLEREPANMQRDVQPRARAARRRAASRRRRSCKRSSTQHGAQSALRLLQARHGGHAAKATTASPRTCSPRRSIARPYYHEFHFWLALADVGLGETDAARRHMTLAIENSTTRKDHDLYAAK